MHYPRLAFVDLETTGLGANDQRIAEIGVVTVDADGVGDDGIDEWETLLDPGRRVAAPALEFGGERGYFCADRASELPQFRDIAAKLAARLEGRLLIAHNARFDYAFLKTEFDRLGTTFAPQVLCTVMLSRKLYPRHRRHDLDALIGRHDLVAGERHRALPDARLLYQFWQTIHRDLGDEAIAAAIDGLLAEPLLPAHLDPGMIEALPECPGVFEFLDGDDQPLLVGRAANLRRHVKRYFRLDRQCARADAMSRKLARIRWHPVSGPLDASLREIALRNGSGAGNGRAGEQAARQNSVSIRIDPAAMPAARIVSLSEQSLEGDLFGIYATERKARNVLRRIASAADVCHRLLGLPSRGRPRCCESTAPAADCVSCSAPHRARDLLRLAGALAPVRLKSWPWPAPIAVREGRTVHVFDRWQHLGSVRAQADLHPLLRERRCGFDRDVYKLLVRALPRAKPAMVRVVAMPTVRCEIVERRAGEYADEGRDAVQHDGPPLP
ncbi:MAG: exonuclease domain-containing protein [Casimicrobiaceae bacterium]